MSKINFDELCLVGMNIDRENGTQKLMEATFGIKEWYVLFETVINNSPKPIVGSINNGFWIFGFTEPNRAKKFMKKMNITGAILKMEPNACVSWLKNYKSSGIKGIRFNEEGKLGWNVTIDNLLYYKELFCKKG